MDYQDMTEEDNLSAKLENLLRVGVVDSVDAAKHTVKVRFEEDDNFVTYDLPVLVPNTYDNSDYRLPDVNEDVVCLFRPGSLEDGFVIGSFYAGEVAPPENSLDVRMVKFKDGSFIKYNRSSHELEVSIQDTYIKAAPGLVNVSTNGNITMKAGGSVTIDAGGAVTIKGSSINTNN